MSEEYEPGLVSVIIPTYNRAHLLKEAMDSVYLQTYRPIELIVVDDGSTDCTYQVVNEFTGRYRIDQHFELRYLQQEHSGAQVARNFGSIESHGEFIQYLDSDDLLLPEKISKTVQAIQKEGAMFAACNTAWFKGGPENIISISNLFQRSASPHDTLISNKLETAAPTYSRKALNAVGPWREDLTIWQDTEFTFRILGLRISGVWLEQVLVLQRQSENSIMNRDIADTCEAMLHTTKRIEEAAVLLGLYDKELLDNCGRRLATVSRMLAQKGYWNRSRKLFLEARKRMTLRNRLIHSAHRMGMRVIGTSLMKRFGLM